MMPKSMKCGYEELGTFSEDTHIECEENITLLTNRT
jgi:hypothetical protein